MSHRDVANFTDNFSHCKALHTSEDPLATAVKNSTDENEMLIDIFNHISPFAVEYFNAAGVLIKNQKLRLLSGSIPLIEPLVCRLEIGNGTLMEVHLG